jgi:hypothetical protein
MNKAYIGDGVYVELEDRMIKLSTARRHKIAVDDDDEDGIVITNTIYLEPEVWAALCEWVSRGAAGFQ